jgi:sulfur-carrier protein
VKIQIPSALTSYTGGRREVDATGPTVGDILLDLDRQFPGIRFRMVDEQGGIRTHMRVFVNGRPEGPGTPVSPDDEIAILMALSGG